MMQTGLRVVVGFTLVALFASPGAAQNDRSWGLLFAYPGSVGVQWDVSDKFGLRLDGDYFQNTFTSAVVFGVVGSSATSTTTTTVRITRLGISTPVTVHARDALTLYAAPRIAISMRRSSSTTEFDSDLPPLFDVDDERSDTEYDPDFSVVFGALYRLGDRFGVFGETGFALTRTTSTSVRGTSSTQSAFGLRAGVGGILYF